MNAIEFKNICMNYGTKEILKNFNLTIQTGEFVTVIGSSGCGKTTVLKLINGLLRPSSGTILIYGKDIGTLDLIKLRRNIGYVIQEIGLFPHMTIEKNISYVPSLSSKRDKAAIHNRSVALAQLVGLSEDMLKRYPNQLSGGQRQRAGIARALMASPDIILMDEPFGAVDEITRKKLQEEIIKIHDQLKNTIVFITHDIKEALRLGTEVIVMDNGHIIQKGTPANIREQPESSFVKELITN